MLNIRLKKGQDLVFEIEGKSVVVTQEELDKIMPYLIMKSFEGSEERTKLYKGKNNKSYFTVMDLREESK